MKRVLFIVSSATRIPGHARAIGYDFSEVAGPHHELTASGIAVDFATPLGGMPSTTDYNPQEPGQRAFHESDAWKRLNRSQRLVDVDVAAYDAIFYPGGLGPTVDLVDDIASQRAIRDTWERGAVVAAVCHGPAALLNARLSDGSLLVAGKQVAAFTNEEEQLYGKDVVPFSLQDELERRGAIHRAGPLFGEQLVEDGQLVTGQNPASARAVARAIVRRLMPVTAGSPL